MIFELCYRDFDDSLLQRIAEISYENDVEDIPSPPDVSHYLVSEVSRDTCARLRVDNFLGLFQAFWELVSFLFDNIDFTHSPNCFPVAHSLFNIGRYIGFKWEQRSTFL